MATDDRRVSTQEDFYDEMGAIRGNTAANEMLYLSSHTIYLQDGINYRKEIFKAWRETFGKMLSDPAWEYIWELYPAFVNIGIIEDMKRGKGISREFVRWKTLIRLEMDLKLIECAEKNVPFSKDAFRDYINDKYTFAFETIVDEVEVTDILYIEDFHTLGKSLRPFKDKIKHVYEMLTQAHADAIKSRLNPNRTSRSRRRRRTSRSRTDRVQATTTTPSTATETSTQTTSETATTPTVESSTTIETSTPTTSEPVVETATKPTDDAIAKEHVIKDYEVIIAEYEEKIRRLERDVAEFQRRHDEIREYSVSQYDRGIKDLFGILNDKRYIKPIEFLYKMMSDKTLDDNFRSYLENFFLALEEMDIEPILPDGQVPNLDAARLTSNYNLDFDRKDFVPEKTAVKYVGWKYKNFILEKPTLKLNE